MSQATVLIAHALGRYTQDLNSWVAHVRAARTPHAAFSRAAHPPPCPSLARGPGGRAAANAQRARARMEVERALEPHLSSLEAAEAAPLSAPEKDALLRAAGSAWPRQTRRLQALAVRPTR